MTSTVGDRLIHTRELDPLSDDRQRLARAAKRGAAHRVRRGTYLPHDAWRDLDDSERYLAFCRAASAASRTPLVLSHWSAAVVLGIPMVTRWPTEVHRLAERTTGGRSRPGMIAHPTRLDSVDVVNVDGMLVTSLARTVVDLAALGSSVAAVTAADFALHRKRPGHLAIDALHSALDAARPMKAGRRVERVLEFATALADSPAESVSRVNIFIGGFESPRLQEPFFDADGLIGETDFSWSSGAIVGEVDGRQKYLKSEFLHGRAPGEAVYEEKLREDRLRATGRRVARWDWWRATDPPRLRAHLLAAGVPLRRR